MYQRNGQSSTMNTRGKAANKSSKPQRKSTSLEDLTTISASDRDTIDSPDQCHVTRSAGAAAASSISDIAALIASMKEATESNNKQLNAKLDMIISDVSTLKQEFSGIKESVSELQTFATDASARIEDIESSKLPGMLKEIKKVRGELEEKLTLFEIHERKLNLLLYGVPKANTDENVYKECFTVFSSLLNIPIEEATRMIPLINAHRLPRRNPAGRSSESRQQPDPIIVRFGRMQDRDWILRASQRPRPVRSQSADASTMERRITIRTDLPPDMKRERGRLASIAYQLRNERKDISTRIIVNGTRVILQTRKNSNPNGPPSAWTAWKETPQ